MMSDTKKAGGTVMMSPSQFMLGAALMIAALILGRDLLIPLAVAVVLWYLINALAQAIGRPWGKSKQWRLPRWLALVSAFVVIGFCVFMIGRIVSSNVAAVAAAAPHYQANLDSALGQLSVFTSERFGTPLPDFGQLARGLDLKVAVRGLVDSLGGLAGDAGLIFIYLAFLFLEQRSFDSKLRALYPHADRQNKVRRLLHQIAMQTQAYVRVKTLIAVLSSALSFVLLKMVGVDYASFWALVIFLMSFIPTIGALVGVLFPALLALVQFPEPLAPFLIVLVGLGAVQAITGNMLEPALMGKSLNQSTLVILLSLAFWGSIWGVAGMFLCTPLTGIAMIICSHFPQTKWIAVLLSSDGRIVSNDAEPVSIPKP
ncbi:MAG: AI-2E family transporter [Alphaproteobacteria bacterium]|nr:MAG: AI-2E family transporter [Alphaproteobacteria bacterium]